MSQKSIFSYFSTKPQPSITQSPISKKANALRALKKITIQDNLIDVEDIGESEHKNERTKELVTDEKLMEQKIIAKQIINTPNNPTVNPKNNKPEAKVKKLLKQKTVEGKVVNIDTNANLPKSSSIPTLSQELPLWLTKNLMDSQKRRPDEPGYDPTTVFIPETENDKFTPFQKQYWRIKKNNFDAIVLIRKGKFFEMSWVDAFWGRDVLKLHLTWHGREPICGIPKNNFNEWAIKIINAGRRVCKVDQVETAVDQKNRNGAGTMIQRELIQTYSIGTIDDFEMLDSSQPAYLLSLRSSGRNRAGVCLVDCSTGTFHLGVVNEDDLSDTLIRFEPVEVIYNPDTICIEHLDAIKRICGSVASRAKGTPESWDGNLALNAIQRIADWEELPEILETFEKDAIGALGGCVAYLNEHKIGKPLLSLQRFMNLNEAGVSTFLSLDSSALTNLQILGKDTEHTLLGKLDRCVTSFGKRRLRFWLMHPLKSKSQIEERLNTVEELMKPEFANVAKRMSSIPDLERMLSRVYSNRCSVRAFIDSLNGIKNIGQFFSSIEKQVESNLMRAYVHPIGKGNEIMAQIESIMDELDINESLESNEFVVKKGVYADVDEIDLEVEGIEAEFDAELKRMETEIGCSGLKYHSQGTVRYQVVIPLKYNSSLPSRYELVSKTKDVGRYHTKEILDLISKLENAENERLKRRLASQKKFLQEFSKNSEYWDSLVSSCADIDCLFSLAEASSRWRASGICRPIFVTKDSEEANGNALLTVKNMRHPCLKGEAIPNDVNISNRPILMITGPNASGKSTYARMCCIAIVLAQIGCFLPAESATLTVFDQIFTRIGASDRLFSGQSTFGVELAETGRLMKNATSDSFVVLDELGRGTSTFDGIAIADSVLKYFIKEKKCPLVFCTHYHVLAEQYDGHPLVRNASMKNEVRDKLILYYELIDGLCDNSFGCKVAKLCGLSDELTEEAQKVADEFESRHAALHAKTSGLKIEAKELRPELEDAQKKLQLALEPNDDLLSKAIRLISVAKEIQGMDLG